MYTKKSVLIYISKALRVIYICQKNIRVCRKKLGLHHQANGDEVNSSGF